MNGSEWWKEEVPEKLGEGYVKVILKAIEDGHALLRFQEVTIGDLRCEVMSRPLAIGCEKDYVYLYGLSAQACDRIAVALASVGWSVMTPTSLVLDALAELPDAEFIGPHTQTNGAVGMTKGAAKHHSDLVQADEKKHDPCSVLVGYCKTYTLNPRYRKGYACEYWWPVSDEYARRNASWLPGGGANASRNGYVVQPEQLAHFYSRFFDYSMAAVYMRTHGLLFGLPADLREMVTDTARAAHISLHGVLSWFVHPEALGPEEPSEPDVEVAPTLRLGDRGGWVGEWQAILINSGLSLAPAGADEDFGPTTKRVTERWQRLRGLKADGVVGPKTWAASTDTRKLSIPIDPTAGGSPFKPIVGTAGRQSMWGSFTYVSAPVSGNPEAIRITDDWVSQNIVSVICPQLMGIPGAPKTGKVYLHRKIADQFLGLWQAWEDAGLLHFVKSWAGLWVPRYIRGSRSSLSNHAFGTAFDINAPWNPLGATPKYVGDTGSVRELVPLAWDHGFYWGGDFKRRPDGMHFEAAEVM